MMILWLAAALVLLVGCSDKQPEVESTAETMPQVFTEMESLREGTGETEMSSDQKEAAVLRFSSFSGGGYEYTVSIDDPSVASCETRYEYEDNAEEIDGASYDFIVTFTGLKPGKTTAAVYGRSPILENEDSIYEVTVDEDLNVTLRSVRSLAIFYLYRNGDIAYDSYNITREEDGYYVSVNEEEPFRIRTEAADQLLEIIEKYDLESWDGFSESATGVLDGQGFWIEFTLTDGTHVSARGDNAFPEHYFDAIGAIQELLDELW